MSSFFLPRGVDSGGLDFYENLEKTKELLVAKQTIFETGIQLEDFMLKLIFLRQQRVFGVCVR